MSRYASQYMRVQDRLITNVMHRNGEFMTTQCHYAVARFVANVQECWQKIYTEGPPGLLIIDWWEPEGEAVAFIRRVGAMLPFCRLLVMSGDEDYSPERAVRRAGAHGFLRKGEPLEIFAKAVSTLRQGGVWFSNPSTTEAAASLRSELPLSAQDLGLTDRQGQVLALMLRGLPNKLIAKELAISVQTTKEHVTAILAKVGARNRVEAIAMLLGRLSFMELASTPSSV